MGAVNGLKLVPQQARRRRRLHYGCRPRPVAAAESRTRSAQGQSHTVTGSVKKMLRWAGFLGVGPPSVGSEWAWAPEIRILANWSLVHSTCVLTATAAY